MDCSSIHEMTSTRYRSTRTLLLIRWVDLELKQIFIKCKHFKNKTHSPFMFSFLFVFLGAFVLFPLCGEDYGNGCFPWPLYRWRLHSAFLQAVARETHHSGWHGVSGSRPPQQPCLDPVSVLYTSIRTVQYTLKNWL